MKLVALKLVSLLLLAGVLLALLHFFGLGLANQAVGALGAKLLTEDTAALSPLGYLVLVVLTVLSAYALLPRIRRSRGNLIFAGDHGDVMLELDSVQKTLTKVLRKMEEIRDIKVRVTPDEDREKAEIVAEVVLNHVPGLPTREARRRVSHYLYETAVNLLGLEDLATIDLKVVGVRVDAKATSAEIAAKAAAAVPASAPLAAPEPEAAPEETAYTPEPEADEEWEAEDDAVDTYEPGAMAEPEEEAPAAAAETTAFTFARQPADPVLEEPEKPHLTFEPEHDAMAEAQEEADEPEPGYESEEVTEEYPAEEEVPLAVPVFDAPPVAEEAVEEAAPEPEAVEEPVDASPLPPFAAVSEGADEPAGGLLPPLQDDEDEAPLLPPLSDEDAAEIENGEEDEDTAPDAWRPEKD